MHSQNECAILGFEQKRAIQLHKLNKRCQINCLLKRETGVIPVRTRHRILRVKADDHWVTGKGPERLINKSGELPFVVREPEVPCHEGLAVHMNRMRDGMYFQRVFTSW